MPRKPSRSKIVPDLFVAAVLTKTGNPLEFVEVTTPDELSPGQVLIRMIFSGACASQIHEIDGRKGPDAFLPHLLGHEAVAEVVWCGPHVQTVASGDIVVAHWRKGSGIQSAPPTLNSSIGPVNAGSVTTFSQYSVVSENRLSPLPEGISLESATLLGCAFTTGFGAVVHEAKVRPGESALIVGFGGIGISILKTLKLVSSTPVVVLDVSEEKLELAMALGADHAFNVNLGPEEIHQRISRVMGSEGADIAFEATGIKSAIEMAYRLTNSEGRTLLLGVPDSQDPAVIPTLPLHLGKQLLGSHGGSSNPDVDIPRIAAIVRAGLLNLDDFPIATYDFGDIGQALETLRSGTLGRVLIKFS